VWFKLAEDARAEQTKPHTAPSRCLDTPGNCSLFLVIAGGNWLRVGCKSCGALHPEGPHARERADSRVTRVPVWTQAKLHANGIGLVASLIPILLFHPCTPFGPILRCIMEQFVRSGTSVGATGRGVRGENRRLHRQQ
jgi:hypothetical protein